MCYTTSHPYSTPPLSSYFIYLEDVVPLDHATFWSHLRCVAHVDVFVFHTTFPSLSGTEERQQQQQQQQHQKHPPPHYQQQQQQQQQKH